MCGCQRLRFVYLSRSMMYICTHKPERDLVLCAVAVPDHDSIASVITNFFFLLPPLFFGWSTLVSFRAHTVV